MAFPPSHLAGWGRYRLLPASNCIERTYFAMLPEVIPLQNISREESMASNSDFEFVHITAMAVLDTGDDDEWWADE